MRRNEQLRGTVAALRGPERAGNRLVQEVGLLPEPDRVSGQRRYDQSVLRRLAVIDVAQRAGLKEGRGLLFALAGAVALAGYGAVAALQPDANFGRVLAAYGGVFMIMDAPR